MSKWKISKDFTGCYGHRVHRQIINTEYTERGHTCAACRHIHGHQLLVRVFFESEELNNEDMVVDFVWTGWLKNFIDDYIDHKFIMDVSDPLLSQFMNGTLEVEKNILWLRDALDGHQSLELKPVVVPGTDYVAGYTVKVDHLEESPQKEFYEGLLLVDFVPTSERLAEWLQKVADSKMKKIGVKTTQVLWMETPKSRAEFTI